jgi:hypothetical protein
MQAVAILGVCRHPLRRHREPHAPMSPRCDALLSARCPSRQIRTIQGFLSTQGSGPVMIAVLQRESAMSTTARRLLLHRDLAELERLAFWIEGWAMRDLSHELSFAIQVCLEEAAANIIMYSTTTDDRLEIVSRSSARTKLWLLGSRIMGAHSIRPSFRGHPFRLRSRRQRPAISVSV